MQANFSLDYDFVTLEQPKKLYLLARFEAGQSTTDQARRPINLSLVIDRSGSMAGNKLDYTRHASTFLIQHLGAQDIFSLVLYNDDINTMVQPDHVTNKDAIIQQLSRIQANGTTNLSGGWLEGCQHVNKRLSDQYINRVILMSDGLANRGVTDTPALVSMSRQKREEGITTTTMGLGKDFNEDLMMEMAKAGGGAFYFIESPEVAPQIFQEELSGLLKIVGQNLTISFLPGAHVADVQQLNAYPEQRDGRNRLFRLGDIFGNEVKTLVLELQVPALASLGEMQVATLRFEYDDVSADGTSHHVREFPIMINVSPDGASAGSPNAEVTRSVLLLKAAQARDEAVNAADRGNFKHASEILRNAIDNIERSGIVDDNLRDESVALREQASRFDIGPDAYDVYERKMMSTQSHYTRMDRHAAAIGLRNREQERTTKSPAQNKFSSSHSVPLMPGITPTHVRWNQQEFKIRGEIMRIGRDAHNEIAIDLSGISRFHSQIRRIGDKLVIEDLGSTNGTFVSGNPITQPHELSVGDVVQIGDAELVFLHRND
jgi:Ca-activated chloride channel family protein